MSDSLYSWWETAVCRTVCTVGGKQLYVGQSVQLVGNSCMLDSLYMWWITVVCTTVCTGSRNICMYDSVQVVETVVSMTICTCGGNSCMSDSLYRWWNSCMYDSV